MGKLRVGFAQVNITPDFPVPLDSYGNIKNRIHDRVLNDLYYKVVAVTDEDDKTLILSVYDITQCRADIRDLIVERVQKELGIDPDYFHLSGTHTHSSVAIYYDSDEMENYRRQLIDKVVKACKTALNDRKEAEIYVGSTHAPGLNFVRHYMRADGTITGDNYGYISKAPSVKHMTEVDDELRLVKFARKNEDGSEARDIVLINWQAHNHLTGGNGVKDLAADYSGALCSWVESYHNCHAVFLQGCAGNVNEKSRIGKENKTKNYLEYGRMLCEHVNEIYDNENLKKMPCGKVKSIKSTVHAAVNREGVERIEDATKIKQYTLEHGHDEYIKKLAVEMGFHSSRHAVGIYARSQIAEDFIDIPVRVYSIGDVGFSAAPCEMFDQTGKEIRAASPFGFTVTQGYTDANYYYLPTKTAFEYGCYEVDTTRYARGTAEQVRDKMIEMLKSIK